LDVKKKIKKIIEMIVFTPIIESEIKDKPLVPKYDGKKMSFEEFQNWEPEDEVGVKYEWNNGILEAEEKMKLEEIYIFTNIQKVFQKKSKMSKNSYFISEVNIYL
jgi:hypothetical protein